MTKLELRDTYHLHGRCIAPLHPSARERCRACSTAERTATNIVIAPIARAHRAAPHTPAPCSCSSCSPLLILMLVLPAPCSCSHCSLLALLALALPAPHSHCSLLLLLALLLLALLLLALLLLVLLLSRSCSLHSQLPFRLWRCSRTFPSTTCVHYSIFRLCFSALSLAPWTLLFLV